MRSAVFLIAAHASLLLACTTAASPAAYADEAPPSPVAALQRGLAQEPNDAALAFFLAVFEARAGNRDAAFEALKQTLANGNGFLPTAEVFPALAGDPRFAVMRARFERRLPRKVDGTVRFALRDRALIPEGIAFDDRTRRFYVGSIAKRGIFAVQSSGELRALSRPEDDLDAILGLAIDSPRRTLYAVSTGALVEAGAARPRNAVKVYDLDARKLRASIAVPEARQLNDVAVAPDGTVLVTDSAAGAVYRIDAARGTVATVVKPDGARGANGIAVSPDGTTAYVAANRRPLRVDLATGEVAPLTVPPRENAALIDGLYWHLGALIGIQNLTTPGRVVRMALAPDGRSVTALHTLQSHHQPAFHEPTTAAVAPDGLYVLARTYVTRFKPDGKIEDPKTLERPLILRVPLG